MVMTVLCTQLTLPRLPPPVLPILMYSRIGPCHPQGQSKPVKLVQKILKTHCSSTQQCYWALFGVHARAKLSAVRGNVVSLEVNGGRKSKGLPEPPTGAENIPS